MSNHSLSQGIDLFLNERIETTRKSYQYILVDLLNYLPEGILIEDVDPEMLVKYIHLVRSRPTVKSPATVNKAIKTLKVCFNWFVKMQWISSSPASVLVTRKTNISQRQKAMTDEEYLKLLEVCEASIKAYPNTISNYRTLALMLFLGDTGARARGCATLRLEDIDLDEKRALVTEKGDKTRFVWFGERCAAAIEIYLKKRQEWLDEMGYELEGSYIFSPHGVLMENCNIGRIVRRLCKRAGIRSLGSHSLRHRKGVQLGDSKIAPSVAATALGHTLSSITLEYYYPKDTERAEAAIRQLSADGIETAPTPPNKEQRTDPKIIDLKKYLAG